MRRTIGICSAIGWGQRCSAYGDKGAKPLEDRALADVFFSATPKFFGVLAVFLTYPRLHSRVVLQPPQLLFLRFGLERGLAFLPAEKAVTPQTPQSVVFWFKTQLKYLCRCKIGYRAHPYLHTSLVTVL